MTHLLFSLFSVFYKNYVAALRDGWFHANQKKNGKNTQKREKHETKTKSIKLEQQKKQYISIIPYLKTVKQMV